VPRDHIKFLDINPTDAQFSYCPWGTIDDDCRTYGKVRTAMEWLKAQSTSSDNVLIFIASHGGGYLPGTSLEYTDGRIDYSGYEGSETWDGSKWFGVDECIVFKDAGDSSVKWCYWDDDFKTDLAGISYKQMTIVLMSCFSGGFIDDLSATNRIIVSSSSETKTTAANPAGFTPFIGYFIDALNGDALHRYHATWNQNDANNRIVDRYEITVPDRDCNGIDWRDAYAYARDQYPYDSPWFDSNGNKIPTYKNGKDYIEYFLWIWHNYGGYTTPDAGAYEYLPGIVVSVYATPYDGYKFDHWLPDTLSATDILLGNFPYWNPYKVTMDKDHHLYGYFQSQSGGGGGDGCPKLYIWNGNCYTDYGVINIQNPSGEDVIREVPIAKQDLAVEGYKAKIRLQEGWLGLNYSHSEIDQVKLYATVKDESLPCPLKEATYHTCNVQPILMASDNLKLDTYLLEIVDLEFAVPYQNIQNYTFTIEGCNMIKN
jgi:hypothetical protein